MEIILSLTWHIYCHSYYLFISFIPNIHYSSKCHYFDPMCCFLLLLLLFIFIYGGLHLGPNYKFEELIWSNQGLNCIIIEVWCPIRDLIEKIRNQGPNRKRRINKGAEIDQIRGKIEEIRSSLINWGLNPMNPKPKAVL